MSNSFDEGWNEFMAAAGPVLVSALSEAAPVGDPSTDPDSGTLAGSMEFKSENDELVVGSADHRGPIARFVVRGTRPHPIDPVVADRLHWIGPEGDVYAMHVDHPGTEANPFHLTAWESAKDEVLALYRERVGAGALAVLNPWRDRKINL